jgi:DNA-binding GntR family transcriptional regulator
MSATWTPDPRPLFTRVVDEIVAQIRDGRLRPGDRVPSSRELGIRYGVASMTALRAMQELKALGATYGIVGKGTFVRSDAVVRLTTPVASPGCARCEDEAGYAKQLVGVIRRAHQLADQLDTRAPADTTAVATEVRRLASILAGGLLDLAHYLDNDGTRHRHDDNDYVSGD